MAGSHGHRRKETFATVRRFNPAELVEQFTKRSLLARFGVEMVPILYRGPFSRALVDQHTDGPTTMCSTKDAGAFAGREGIVITPVCERVADAMIPTGTHGRVILKSISADYLARKGGTDSH